MKSRVIDTFHTVRMQFATVAPRRRIGRGRLALSGAASALLLSGCYYPYGYYPGYYAAYPSYYATVPASAAQREVPLGTTGDSQGQQSMQQQSAQAQYGQQPQPGAAASPPAYVVAQPPVYVAPAYPAYYPPPVEGDVRR